MDDNFNFYTDDDSKKLKSDLRKILTNLNSLICKFLTMYESNPKLQKEIQELIYQEKIYHNKKKLFKVCNLVKNAAESVNLEEIKEKKKQSVMHQKRADEMGKVKQFVQGTFLKMLPDTDTSLGDKDKHIKNAKSTSNNVEFTQEIKASHTEQMSKNILIMPKFPKQETLPEKEEKDDIKVETVLLGKKTIKEKEKDKKQVGKNTNLRSEVIFRSCYTCKVKFNGQNTHSFYTNLCSACGDYNYSFREMKLDFTGRIAVITGGRVKIGYFIVLKLLHYGCKVIFTTRFPKDALMKYKQEQDYDSFKDNLVIYPIDFRIFDSTVRFVNYLTDNFPHLDILINNAAQTVRRTTSYYKYLLQIEAEPLSKDEEKKIINNDFVYIPHKSLDSGDCTAIQTIGGVTSNTNRLLKTLNITNDKNLPLSVIASQIKIMQEKDSPSQTLMGGDGQPIDFSQSKNSWNLELDEIPFQEFSEVQIINTWTPYYLSVKLKPLMEKSPFADRYIINVSSVEGIFNHFKRTTHPHTNMAKAALNMMTRTCGKYYKQFGIYMTSVDTGWVSPMNEFNNLLKQSNSKAFEEEFVNIPLDELDGAMRVIHPIIEGIKNKNYIYGYLLKDYKTTNW